MALTLWIDNCSFITASYSLHPYQGFSARLRIALYTPTNTCLLLHTYRRRFAFAQSVRFGRTGKQVLTAGCCFRFILQAKMLIRPLGRNPSPRGPHNEALLNQVRLIDVFQGISLFADGADSESIPTGPPANLSINAISNRRSIESKPLLSTFNKFSA